MMFPRIRYRPAPRTPLNAEAAPATTKMEERELIAIMAAIIAAGQTEDAEDAVAEAYDILDEIDEPRSNKERKRE